MSEPSISELIAVLAELASIQADTLRLLERNSGDKTREKMLADRLIKKGFGEDDWPERDFNFLRRRTLLVLKWLLERQDQNGE